MLKVVFFFSSKADGWSETYWNTGVDPHTLIQDVPLILPQNPVVGTLTDLIVQRLKMSSPQSFLSHCRVSLEGTPFNFATYDGAEDRTFGTYVPPAGVHPAPEMELWSDALVAMDGVAAGGFQLHRRMWLRGMPEAILVPPQQFVVEPLWDAAFKSWVNCLTHGAWVCRGRPDRGAAVQITGFAHLADAQSAYLQPVPVGVPAVATQIIIRGTKYPVGWNGFHTAISVAAVPVGVVGDGNIVAGPALLIKPGRRHFVTNPEWGPQSGGTIQVMSGATERSQNIGAAHVVRITSHKVGRPFGLPVGRRRQP